LKRRTD